MTRKKDDEANVINCQEYNTILESYIQEYNFGVDIEGRIIYLSGEIEENSFDYVVQRISLLRKFDNKLDINFIINSFGGDVYAALGIIDYIKSLPIKINTYCYTKAMSAGAFVLISGTGKRYISKNSNLMLHEMSSDSSGKASDVKAETKHIKNLEEQIYDVLVEASKKGKAYWKKHLSPDLYLLPEQAKAFGLIDEII